MSDGAAQIAIVGDLHSAWAEEDVEYFNDSGYDLVLFTGDLAAPTRKDGVRIAKSISRIEREALVMPGSADVAHYGTLAAELAYRKGMKSLMREIDFDDELERRPTESQARFCGYSSHAYRFDSEGVTVIAGRPFSQGGPELSSPGELAYEFGVRTMEDSAARLRELVDGAPTRSLIFLSHNGPSGLGGDADSPWGNDFLEQGGDWGDPDLADAVAYAKGGRHRVLAVIAGHMHSPTRGGRARTWQVERDETLYINPARVPRIFEGLDGHLLRHYVALGVTGEGVRAEERLVRS